MRWILPARLPDPRDLPMPVHDGDTLWVTLDTGRRDKTDLDVRLKGVKAPEFDQPGGPETHQYVMDWLEFNANGKKGRADASAAWPFAVETFKTRGGNDVLTLNRWTGVLWAGDPEQVRRGVPLACLNSDVTAWLKTQDPTWGGGIGG